MRRRAVGWFLAILGWTLLAPNQACSADDLPDGFASKPDRRFKVSQDPFYRRPQDAIRYRVAADKKNNRVNFFCVAGYQWMDGSRRVLVLWKEEATLMDWGGSRYDDLRESSLSRGAGHNTKLGRDTVKNPDDINGSTYLETEQWWHAVANDCMKHGEKYTIEPFKVSTPTTEDNQ
ncbi:MAG TPA: hypothetical protein VKS80_09190 [Trinickia sp.]|nr:hypothetical protein [Trinickia sp.]